MLSPPTPRNFISPSLCYFLVSPYLPRYGYYDCVIAERGGWGLARDTSYFLSEGVIYGIHVGALLCVVEAIEQACTYICIVHVWFCIQLMNVFETELSAFSCDR